MSGMDLRTSLDGSSWSTDVPAWSPILQRPGSGSPTVLYHLGLILKALPRLPFFNVFHPTINTCPLTWAPDVLWQVDSGRADSERGCFE